METNIELSPCPFCGSTDLYAAEGNIFCYGCPAKLNVPRSDPVHAAKLWNTRAPVIPLENTPFVDQKSQLFQDIAEVIGKGLAFQELSRVLDLDTQPEDTIEEAFVWSGTPQGHLFWDAIDNGENPYEL